MKKVIIFDDFYTKSEDLEKEVNAWIELNEYNVINVDVKTYISAFNDEICKNNVKQTVNCIVFYAVVTYKE